MPRAHPRPLACIALMLLSAAIVATCAPVAALPSQKAAMESRAAAIRSSAPVGDKSSDPGRPVIDQTDPPPEVGLLGNVNAPVSGAIFMPTNEWAGWIDPAMYVQVWAGSKGDGTGTGMVFVIRRRGIGDGVHLEAKA